MCADVANDIARAVGQRPVLIATPFVRKNGCYSTDQENVLRIYDMFLDLTGRGAHFANARAWSHMRMNVTPDPKMLFFQIMLAMCEHVSSGSVRPKANRITERTQYVNTVFLTALNSIGRANAEQKKALRQLVRSDEIVDLHFLHDVAHIKASISSKKPAPAEKPAKKKKKKDAEEEEEEPPAAAPPPPPPVPDGPVVRWNLYRRVRMQLGCFSVILDQPIPNVVNGLIDTTPVLDEVRVAMRERLVAASSVADKSNNDFGLLAAPPPYNGPGFVDKVTFTVTVVPREGGDPDIPQDVVGLYCRFLVRDPALDPGAFFYEMLENVSRRLNASASALKAGGKRSLHSVNSEMFPDYGIFYNTTHATGNWLSREMYFQAYIAMCPEVLQRGTQHSLFTKMEPNLLKDSSHLSRILTTERAINDMHNAGAARAVYTAKWIKGKGTAAYPDKAVTPTYVYSSVQLFWHKRLYAGFHEQMFPHIDPQSDLLVALLNGGNNLDALLCDDDDDPEARAAAAVEAANVRTAASELRNIIDNTRLVSRQTVNNATLVQYTTSNEFMHRAAEAEVINKRVAKERPSHSIETYLQVQAYGKKTRDILNEMGGADEKRFMESWWVEASAEYRNQLMFGDCTPQKLATALNCKDALSIRVKEYVRYSTLITKAQSACARSFASLYQVDGNTDALSIPEQVKSILKWYTQNKDTHLPHMTRPFVMWDPDLDIFGNSTLRILKYFTLVARALQPIVCIMVETSFSCYRHSPAALAVNLMLHGKYEAGKTFLAITLLRELITIPGTTIEYTSSTAAADTTAKHVYDSIICSDEVADWKVSEAAAKLNVALVNREKVKLTRRQVGHNVYSNEVGPNGENVRWTRIITTDHYVALIEVTNAVVEATNPLSSRYFCLTVTQSSIPVREFKGFMGAGISSDAKLHLQINQFLSCAVYKAIQCGAMLEPNMQLFDDLSNRIISQLIEERCINQEGGVRTLEIMTPAVIQWIIRTAIHCAYDMPNSPNYQQKFVPENVCKTQRYLYAQVSHVVWAWTAMGSAWIEENNSSFISACTRCVGVDWHDGTNAYQMYEVDIGKRIPWKTLNNPNHVKGRLQPLQQQQAPAPAGGAGAAPVVVMVANNDKDEDDELIDLNYIYLEGTMEKICRKIADCTTRPRLDWTDVSGIINRLRTHLITIPGGAYVHQPKKTFGEWHRYIKVPIMQGKNLLQEGSKKVDHEGNSMPLMYKLRNGDSTQMRTEADVPRMSENMRHPAVDDGELRTRGRLYIMPQIAAMFRNERILNAIIYAITTRTARPGKYLLGLPDNTNPMNMRTLVLSQERIDQTVLEMDRESGYNEYGEWTGSQEVPPTERPVPRSLGIGFNRRGGIGKEDGIFMTFVPGVPTKPGDNSWRERNERELSNMNRVRDVSVDLDYESALQQHVRIGMPLDEPVHDPAYIVKSFKEACHAANIPWTADKDYPHEFNVDMQARTSVWESSTRHIRAESNVVRNNYALIMEESEKSRKPDVQLKLDEQKKKRDRSSAISSSAAAHGESSRPARGRGRPPTAPGGGKRRATEAAINALNNVLNE